MQHASLALCCATALMVTAPPRDGVRGILRLARPPIALTLVPLCATRPNANYEGIWCLLFVSFLPI